MRLWSLEVCRTHSLTNRAGCWVYGCTCLGTQQGSWDCKNTACNDSPRHLDGFQCVVIINRGIVTIRVHCMCKNQFFFEIGKTKCELWVYTVSVCLVFKQLSSLFPSSCGTLHCTQHYMNDPVSSHFHQNWMLYFFVLKVLVMLIIRQWYPDGVYVCISLMTDGGTGQICKCALPLSALWVGHLFRVLLIAKRTVCWLQCFLGHPVFLPLSLFCADHRILLHTVDLAGPLAPLYLIFLKPLVSLLRFSFLSQTYFYLSCF